MTLNKSTLYYVLVLLGFIGLKFVYTITDNNMLLFLIKPTNSLVSMIQSSSWVYTNDAGFYHETLNIIIDKSCSGFNFMILCYTVFSFTFLKFIKQGIFQLLSIPVSLILAYIITILVNTSRISISILIEKKINLQLSWLHEAQGVFIYLSFLIGFYMVLNHLLTQMFLKNEKLT